MKQYKMKVHTGPVVVNEIAAKLREIPEFTNVSAGTEHVYFTLAGADYIDAMLKAYEAYDALLAKYGTTFGLTPKEV